MVESISNSGINSLGGFVFQIDVFIYYALKLKQGELIEYENIDDVSISNEKGLDKQEDYFRTNIISKETRTAIQVKKQNITKSIAEKVLMNWILLENSELKINKYILFGNAKHNNGSIADIDNQKFFKKIKSSTETNSNSIIQKVKSLFENDYDKFNGIVNQIKSKFNFEQTDSIENELLEVASSVFHKDGVMYPVFIARIKALRSRLSFEILEKVRNHLPYTINYKTIMGIIEDITQNCTDKFPMISFSDYKNLHPIHINEINHLREVKQLRHCNIDDNSIIRRMNRCNYYYDYKFILKEQAKLSLIENIEDTTFENFQDVKEKLKINNQDKPFNRLENTEICENSHCHDEHIRKGVCIYLTKDKSIVDDKQISWKDDEDEES